MAEQQTNGHDQIQPWRRWTPERRRKFKATMKAKAKTKNQVAPTRKKKLPTGDTEDAIIYLRHAVRSINDRLRKGELLDEDPAHLLAKLALKVLQGKM